MRGELIALDLETTGLDVDGDAIIEVGIVRMVDGKVIDTFSSMVDPERQIPSGVTHITGITNDEVHGAPTIEQVLPQIVEFVRDSPVIAHSIAIDQGFLSKQHKILTSNSWLDTYELASVLLPKAPRYNLNSLTHQVGIELAHAHRALDDARATALLYWELWKLAQNLPSDLLQEIALAGERLGWLMTPFFLATMHEKSLSSVTTDRQAIAATDISSPDKTTVLPQTEEFPGIEEIQKLFEAEGVLATRLPDFEYRPQQLKMAQEVADAFQNSKHLLIEAGTGTGKSLAYVTAAALWSAQQKERVLISTYTINLQDQLISKDIPAFQAAMNMNIRASVMKGRANYLCPRRLETIRRRQPTTVDELRTLAKVLVWLEQGGSGDKSELSLRGPAENNIWIRLSAQDEGCSLDRCKTQSAGLCPFYKAREATEQADLVIVNHALLISDVVTDRSSLPDYRYVIIDEAHQFEDAVTSGLSTQIDADTLKRRLADLGGPGRGLLGAVLTNIHGQIPDKDVIKIEGFIQIIGEAAQIMEHHVSRVFKRLTNFLHDIYDMGSTEYMAFVRITGEHRHKDSFARVQNAWKALGEFFEVLGASIARLNKALLQYRDKNIAHLDDLSSSAQSTAHYLEEMHGYLNQLLISPDDNIVYWLTLTQSDETPIIHTAPLHIGGMVEKHLWHQKSSVVMTSATLQSLDGFDFIRDRLYAGDAKALNVGSPFNYRDSTLLYIPTDIPEPNNRQGYQQSVERGIIELAAALDGRVLVLFTSYAQLRQTSQAITARLALGGITVYDQSDGTSRQALLEGFQSTEKAVLLGTRSFWEGIDIPGDSLSALVITRLPFAVPSDPIFAARSDTYPNQFNEYALPDAIIRFRQGFGRLIRRATDRGIVTVFDSRIIKRRYGSYFLEALPDCTMRDGPLAGLPDAAKNWLAK